jgi:hypothetical protein
MPPLRSFDLPPPASMPRRATWPAALAAALLSAWTAAPTFGADLTPPVVRSERVRIESTAHGALVQGSLRRAQTVDYLVRGSAGQTLSVVMSASHVAVRFDVHPPDSDQSMFVGAAAGRRFDAVLPVDGDYVVRISLPRAATRRDDTAIYALNVELKGRPVAPLAAPAEPELRGSGFHAVATVACSHYLKTSVRECRAYVTRRTGDGNASVEVRWPDGGRRRILFLGGMPVASDAAEPMSMQRVGEACQLRWGTVERVEIPETLVRGG